MALLSVIVGTTLIHSIAPKTGVISGTVTYLNRMALRPNSELVVQLDRYDQKGHSNVSEIRMKLGNSQVPVRFSLPYVITDNDSLAKFGLRSQIVNEGKTLYDTASAVMVTLPTKKDIAITVRGVNQTDAWPFLDHKWEFFEIDGKKINFTEKKPSLLFSSKNHQIQGFSGVNGFGGEHYETGPNIQIDPGIMTMMAGSPERMEIEQSILRNLPMVNKRTIEDGELILWRGSRVIARLKTPKP
jgi:heat shock protein HslJ